MVVQVEVDFLLRLFERTINSEIEAFKRYSTTLTTKLFSHFLGGRKIR